MQITLHHPESEISITVEPVLAVNQLPQGPLIHPDAEIPNGMASLADIRIRTAGATRTLRLVGPPCCFGAAVNGDQLTVMQFDLLTLVSLPDGQILRQQTVDCPGGCLGLYPLGDGWLIHAEDAVIRLDRELQPLWIRCGADFFVSVTGRNAFTLRDDRILLRDFSDNYYELDFQGNLIKFIKKASV